MNQDYGCAPIADAAACRCCEGVEVLTPLAVANRPGLSALRYRVGTHGSFLETMRARLSGDDPRLVGLTSHDAGDFSLALLDAWATVADVLTFYQERIANEGYLRTATERRSLLELAHLVGYKPRPGVASSVYLAYTLNDQGINKDEEFIIPKGTRSQSKPQSQTFETSKPLKARAAWNNLQVRLTQPQTPQSIANGKLHLKGISLNLKINDLILIDFGENNQVAHLIKNIEENKEKNLTILFFVENQDDKKNHHDVNDLIEKMFAAKKLKNNSLFANAPSVSGFSKDSQMAYSILNTLHDNLGKNVLNFMKTQVTDQDDIKVYVFRLEAKLFGHNIPSRTKIKSGGEIENIGDWPLIVNQGELVKIDRSEEDYIICLDASYGGLLNDNEWIVIKTPEHDGLTLDNYLISRAEKINDEHIDKYGINFLATKIKIVEAYGYWINITNNTTNSDIMGADSDFNIIRQTKVYARPQRLNLAEEPIIESVCYKDNSSDFELDSIYPDLEAGQWLAISGEQHLPDNSGGGLHIDTGISVSEINRITTITQRQPDNTNKDNKMRTVLTFSEPLQYCYKRDTVRIYGNVVEATHGETRSEVLGSGDASKPLQAFTLKQPPLTYTAASNPSGVDSTLQVYVNDLRWHEADALAGLAPTDRKFITLTDNENKTTLTFGNGQHGARLPTGIENIRAEYRNGIGKAGNVQAGRITELVDRLPGLKEVTNPQPATGGADRDSIAQLRRNAPLAVQALDRLVSVQDYEDFTRLFAGIGKACAVEIADGRRQLVHITIAGVDDAAISPDSDLYRNLLRALRKSGDPYQAIQVDIRERKLLVISAKVSILPDYRWDAVEQHIRAALLEAFSFENRELGQDVLLSEVISVMQAVRGVDYVDVDALENHLVRDSENSNGNIHPAQIAFLSPDIRTLTLCKITGGDCHA